MKNRSKRILLFAIIVKWENVEISQAIDSVFTPVQENYEWKLSSWSIPWGISPSIDILAIGTHTSAHATPAGIVSWYSL